MRLFTALWPGDELRATLARSAAAWPWPAGTRRTDARNLHITLHFFGEVANARVPALRALLRHVRPLPAGTIVLDGADVWKSGIAVRLAEDLPRELAQWHAQSRAMLIDAGFPLETRTWRPHVTLARKAAGVELPAPESLKWPVDGRFALVRSPAGGGLYEIVEGFG
jgi:2'-5' RNA ligase